MMEPFVLPPHDGVQVICGGLLPPKTIIVSPDLYKLIKESDAFKSSFKDKEDEHDRTPT